MRDGRLLGAGCHAEGSQVDGDERGQLLDVLLLALDHAEDDAVPLAHALSVVRPDVLVDDLLPAATAQPTTEETLHLEVGGGGINHVFIVTLISFTRSFKPKIYYKLILTLNIFFSYFRKIFTHPCFIHTIIKISRIKKITLIVISN